MENIFLCQGAIGNELVNAITSIHSENKTTGGHAFFLGAVRNDVVNDKKVVEINYSAYPEMVENEMKSIISEIYEKYKDVQKISIKHSVGVVKAGENSLFVLVSAGHRVEAFKALEESVNLIKARIPIWKKELLDDGSYFWTE